MALLTSQQFPQPEVAERPESTLRAVPDGELGVAATMDTMVRLAKEYSTNLTIRKMAETIITSVEGKNWYGEAEAIMEWVRNNIRYTQDVWEVETVKTPLTLLYDRFGDCDDMALLAGTMLLSIGHPVRFVAVGTNIPGEYEHVYVETKIGQRWVGVETTEDVHLGWVPTPQLARMVRHV